MVLPIKGEPPYRTRRLTLCDATDTIGYGYSLCLTHADWREIAASPICAENDHDTYIAEQLRGYRDDGWPVCLHFDPSELVEIWRAIAELDIP